MTSTGKKTILSARVQQWNAEFVSVIAASCVPVTATPTPLPPLNIALHILFQSCKVRWRTTLTKQPAAKAIEPEPLEEALNKLNLDVENKSWGQATEMITIGTEDGTCTEKNLSLPMKPESPGRAIPTYGRAFEALSFRNTGRGTIELVAPIAEFPVQNDRKTIASLQRLSGFPSIAAMSGWGHGQTKVTVSGKDWTAEVMRISSIVRYHLENVEPYDQGTGGRFLASHAEKQLVACFISKHVLIDNEDEDLLQRAKPPVLLKKATIIVSRPPCDDCLQFIETVNITLGLEILVLDRSER
ncbi:hypothetical protein IQ07DRAFT_677812 [Pyrenochaeta sp. DS3sAY3a]|nr:hypothetical protein IQ07DRAFT_677812 [Pyrenochaeta sp. DS3sAY3a]